MSTPFIYRESFTEKKGNITLFPFFFNFLFFLFWTAKKMETSQITLFYHYNSHIFFTQCASGVKYMESSFLSLYLPANLMSEFCLRLSPVYLSFSPECEFYLSLCGYFLLSDLLLVKQEEVKVECLFQSLWVIGLLDSIQEESKSSSPYWWLWMMVSS